jgi:F-type H+-transporting ATPase subunit b
MYGIFIFLLNEVMLKPVGKVIEERTKKIQAVVDATKQTQSEAQQVVSQYELEVAAKRAEGQKIFNGIVDEAQKKRQAALDAVAAEHLKKFNLAKDELLKEREALMADALAEDEITLVKAMVDKLLGEPALVSLSKSTVLQALKEAH